MAQFTGLTWDHPRGHDALAEAARRLNADRASALLRWNKQPLECFESAPIADLAADNDLLVLDHPHIGEAVAQGCLIPLEELFCADQIAAWRRDSIGPSMRSYFWGGRHWALPLDVATHTMVRRPDVVGDPPAGWDEVLELARKLPVAQSIAGPHAFLTLISIAGGWGFSPGGDAMLPDDPATRALDIMHRLFALRPLGSEKMNPIDLCETMARSHDIVLVPLAFNYVTYSAPGHLEHRLAFSDSLRDPGGFGGVIGGTGIGFSARARPVPELLDHIAWLMHRDTQTGFIPDFGGQPSARLAWNDDAVNAGSGNFYRDTAASAEHALLRPRFDGYVAFQAAAADRLRQALETGENEPATLSALRGLWRRARETARGDLDDDRGHQKND